jgi:SAM-dependent methyltransferase
MQYIEDYKNYLRRTSVSPERDSVLACPTATVSRGQRKAGVLHTFNVGRESSILELGCGDGELAQALRLSHRGRYVGTDLLPERCQNAQRAAGRSDWQFLENDTPTLPFNGSWFDAVCAFDFFTHFLDEEVYRYFVEVRRVLKLRGLFILSYYDLAMPGEWRAFENVLAAGERSNLVRFFGRDTWAFFAAKAGFEIIDFWGGDWFKVKLEDLPEIADVRAVDGAVQFGQSVCVCRAK